MGKFREHGVLIYLSHDLYMGFVKLQADRGLGRSFAALLPFVEGLYHMGYISKEVYEVHKNRYSQPLVEQKSLTAFSKEKQQLKTDLTRAFQQWDTLSDKAKSYWIDKARKNADFPIALQILEKAEGMSAVEGRREAIQ